MSTPTPLTDALFDSHMASIEGYVEDDYHAMLMHAKRLEIRLAAASQFPITVSSVNPWEETITWQPAQPVTADEPWLVCLEDGQVGQATMMGLDWYWSENVRERINPITARVTRMARLPIGPPLPFHS